VIGFEEFFVRKRARHLVERVQHRLQTLPGRLDRSRDAGQLENTASL
jgi:hypothetical protein